MLIAFKCLNILLFLCDTLNILIKNINNILYIKMLSMNYTKNTKNGTNQDMFFHQYTFVKYI